MLPQEEAPAQRGDANPNEPWYKYIWTEQGVQEYSKDKKFWSKAPKVGAEVTDKELEVLMKKQGWANKNVMVREGMMRRIEAAWETRNASQKQSQRVQVGAQAVHSEATPQQKIENLKKLQKLHTQITKQEKEMKGLKEEQDKIIRAMPNLAAPPVDFMVDDKPDLWDDHEEHAIDHVTEGDYEPPDNQGDYQPEVDPEIPERKERMKSVEAMKAHAIHNCLATSSCQMLRKDVSKLQGDRPSNLGMFFKKRKQDVLKNVVQRCLSHTSLYGPANAYYCETDKIKYGGP